MSIFSSPSEIEKIRDILSKYIRLPFSDTTIPGSIMEGVLSHVRGGTVLNTYDFVDVYDSDKKIGWQVKATKASTPLTWKRAKIANKQTLIAKSRNSDAGLQALGDAIIDFCNKHAAESLRDYALEEIGLSRLVIGEAGNVFYYEKKLCDLAHPKIFEESDFIWRWSSPKNTTKKEQLSALHGIYKLTGDKWWAWHGLGENQLHFSGEHHWWPSEGDEHRTDFRMPSPSERIPLDDFITLLDGIDELTGVSSKDLLEP